MRTISWPTRFLLTAAAVTTAVAGVRYACYPNRDSAVEAAYFLGVSARAGNADARVKLDHLFPDDARAQTAYEHGLASPASPPLVAGATEIEPPRHVRRPRPRHHSPVLRLVRRGDAEAPGAARAPLAAPEPDSADNAHPVSQPSGAADPDDGDRSLT